MCAVGASAAALARLARLQDEGFIEAERVDILVVFDERGELPADEPKEQKNETGEKPQ